MLWFLNRLVFLANILVYTLRRCPKAKSVEQQSSPPSRNIPGVDKGKKPIASEGKDVDGFVQVKTQNWNRGQKRNLMERQEEDTFNKFEILDVLGQQEVNHGLINVDQHAGDSSLEIISSTPYASSHVESTIPRVMEGQEEVQTILEPNVVIE